MSAKRDGDRRVFLWTGIFLIIVGIVLAGAAVGLGATMVLIVISSISLALLGAVFVWHWNRGQHLR